MVGDGEGLSVGFFGFELFVFWKSRESHKFSVWFSKMLNGGEGLKIDTYLRIDNNYFRNEIDYENNFPIIEISQTPLPITSQIKIDSLMKYSPKDKEFSIIFIQIMLLS